MCRERKVQTADAYRFFGSLLPLLTLSEDAVGDVIRSLRRMSAPEAASSDTALPEEESLWTLPNLRQWSLSFRAFHRSADKSLRDFLKGRHGDFLRGVNIVEVPQPRQWRRGWNQAGLTEHQRRKTSLTAMLLFYQILCPTLIDSS